MKRFHYIYQSAMSIANDKNVPSYLINGLDFGMIKNVMHFGKDHEMRKSRGTHQLPFPTVGRRFVFGNNLFAFIIGQINVLLLWQKILEFPYCQCYSTMCSSILKRKIITFLQWLIKTVEFLCVVIVNWMWVLTAFESLRFQRLLFKLET